MAARDLLFHCLSCVAGPLLFPSSINYWFVSALVFSVSGLYYAFASTFARYVPTCISSIPLSTSIMPLHMHFFCFTLRYLLEVHISSDPVSDMLL